MINSTDMNHLHIFSCHSSQLLKNLIELLFFLSFSSLLCSVRSHAHKQYPALMLIASGEFVLNLNSGRTGCVSTVLSIIQIQSRNGPARSQTESLQTISGPWAFAGFVAEPVISQRPYPRERIIYLRPLIFPVSLTPATSICIHGVGYISLPPFLDLQYVR